MIESTQVSLFQKLIFLFYNLGPYQAITFIKEKVNQKFHSEFFTSSEPYVFSTKNAEHPLACRPATSDIHVFGHIFINREYACLDDLSDVDLIIDCGANVGYSSAYFLTKFPRSKVIAVEPDPSNFLLLENNLADYNDRVTLIQSGVWSHTVGLKIDYQDNAWATQVRECSMNESPDIQAVDIETLLLKSGNSRISILKIDIEGAEAIVFADNYESWLPYVDNIVIELHHDTSFGPTAAIFFDAISNQSFDISMSGELTVCKARTDLKQSVCPQS